MKTLTFMRTNETYYQVKDGEFLFELIFEVPKSLWVLRTYRRIACSWRLESVHDLYSTRIETYDGLIDYFLKTFNCDVRWEA